MNNIMKTMNQINNENKQKHEENNKNPKTKISWADNKGHNLTTINNYQIENEEENEDWDQFIQQNTEEDEKYFNTNFTYNEKKVQDAMFGEAIVFGEHINVIFDTGSKGCAISKQFLDCKKQSIDGPSSIKLIDIQGNRVTPSGEKNNVQINIEGIDISADMVVTESKDYNIIPYTPENKHPPKNKHPTYLYHPKISTPGQHYS